MFYYTVIVIMGLCLFIAGYMLGLDKGQIKAHIKFNKLKTKQKQLDKLKTRNTPLSTRALRLVKTHQNSDNDARE